MAVPGDLADPGKVTPVLCLFGPRLWPFEPTLLVLGLASKWGFHRSPQTCLWSMLLAILLILSEPLWEQTLSYRYRVQRSIPD